VDEGFNEDTDAQTGFLDCALAIAKSIDGLEARAEIISLIAVRYVAQGQPDAAVDLAETIDDSYLRDQALAGVAIKCIQVGADDYGEKLSETIEDETAYALAMEQMAIAYAESGALEKAIEVAHRSADSAPTLNLVALACLGRGLPAEALEVARSIDYPDLKAPFLIELAARAFADGREAEAIELLPEATSVAGEIEFPDQQVSGLMGIASLNQKCGQEEQALEMLARARSLCDESAGPARDAGLVQIAGAFAELHRYDSADQTLEEIGDAFQFAQATANVALEYHRAGDSTKALTLLADALGIARDEEVYGEQSLLAHENLLDLLAIDYALLGHYEEALQIPDLMSSQDQRNRTLRAIAKLCVSTGNHSRVFQVAELIQDTYPRVLCDLEIVDAFVAAEQLELADHTLAEAVARAAAIDRAYDKTVALMEIASRLARREQAAKALDVLFDALNSVALIDDRYRQSHSLLRLAGLYSELGQQTGEREGAVLEEIRFKLEY
jgi:tetratricopeptide (TPR) repeat protein